MKNDDDRPLLEFSELEKVVRGFFARNFAARLHLYFVAVRDGGRPGGEKIAGSYQLHAKCA
ncbi:MAG: hypothetical protein IPH39_18150 [Sulfuritalea sp.]|nr:hypothetical protein [Sulfuritalea sp.]